MALPDSFLQLLPHARARDGDLAVRDPAPGRPQPALSHRRSASSLLPARLCPPADADLCPACGRLSRVARAPGACLPLVLGDGCDRADRRRALDRPGGTCDAARLRPG